MQTYETYGLEHHDNRDFDVLANFQPRGQATFNEQTLSLGTSPGVSIDCGS
jgi:hypothetical protein